MSICGTDSHMAPEMQLGDAYDRAVDVYSFGVMMIELMTRKQIGSHHSASHTFLARRPETLFEMDLTQVRAICESVHAPPSLIELACQCCQTEPTLRPAARDVWEWLDDLLNEIPESGVPPPPVPPLPMVASRTHATLDVEAQLKPLESIDDVDDETVENPPAHPRLPVKQGWMFKRKMHGLRLWRKRWFVLRPEEATLTWYNNADEATKGSSRGSLSLFDSVIIRGSGFRFKILTKDEIKEMRRSDLDNRELAAASEDILNEWLTAIRAVIDAHANDSTNTFDKGPFYLPISPSKDSNYSFNSNGSEQDDQLCSPRSAEDDRRLSAVGSFAQSRRRKKWSFQENKTSPFPQKKHGKKHGVVPTVTEWLAQLHMSQYQTAFETAGYSDVMHIQSLGLNEDDFTRLGITNPLHKRVFLDLGSASWCPQVQVKVIAQLELNGIVVFEVRAAWKFWRSSLMMREEDFSKLHGALTLSLKRPGRRKGSGPLMLPDLPEGIRTSRSSRGSEKSAGQESIQSYLDQIVTAVDDGHHLDELVVILRHLRLGWTSLNEI
eukprot:c6240_g1_i1.p1 GENE.c6240_g1_i1~~c6240_g1_i1.p1  ORF type:complete len:618 (+),score=101.48 c6240_g1_i1:203-1855(+)